MFRMTTFVLCLMISSNAWASPIMVFMGGFGSCALDGKTTEIKSSAMMNQTMDQVQQAYTNDIIEIRTCYALGNDPIYVSSGALDLQSAPMNRDQLAQLVEDTAAANENAPIYLWGQSHGGWTAMDLVRRLPNLNYRALHTVDPISVRDCGPAVFIGGVISGSSPGCRRAPQDLEPHYAQISKSVARWTNWFQLEFTLLHSSKITAAHENVERSFDAGWWIPMGAHRLMETDETMWRKVANQITSDVCALPAP